MEPSNQMSHVTQYRRPWWKGARQWWPLLVFTLISILAVLLYSNGGKYRVMSGTAERIVETIAPIETARIVRVNVIVGDRVHAGDVIAELDTSTIDAESAVLKEQIAQSRLESQLEQLTLERQFASARQQAEQALRDAQQQFKVDTVEHDALVEEIARLKPLFEQQLIPMETLVTKQASERVLAETLKLAPDNIRALIEDVERAKAQQASALARLAERKERLTSEIETINLLNIRRDAYTLRARQDGVIAQVDQRAGDVVEPGASIVSLLIDGPSSIVGFLPESNLSAIAIGTPANIYPTVSIRDTGVVAAHVVQISPAIYSLPERVSPIRGQVVRGRRVTLALDEEVLLVPGESVSIEMESSLFEPVSLED
jgi:multidrug resistance efflux pump